MVESILRGLIIGIPVVMVLSVLARRARRLNKKWAVRYDKAQTELVELYSNVWTGIDKDSVWERHEGILATPWGMWLRLLGWVLIDAYNGFWRVERKFPFYGLWIYEGYMGSGKTSSMQGQVQEWRKLYPRMKVVANYDCTFADHVMTSWKDFFDITNGEDGVCYLIDEISTMWDSNSYKDFPPELLQEVVQQRKERKVILGSAQHFMRIIKTLREQTMYVVRCRTFAGRLTVQTCYHGYEYERWHDAVVDPKTGRRGKLNRVWRKTFMQTNEIRRSFDTYAKVQMMARSGFVPREKQIRYLERK